MGLLLAGVGALLAWWYSPRPLAIERPRTGPVQASAPLASGGTGVDDLPAIPVEQVWFWQAVVDPQAIHRPWRLGPLELTLLGLGMLGLAWHLWRRYQRRFPSIEPLR